MERSQEAVALFCDSCNCAQSVLIPFCEDFGLDSPTALRLADGFGGGIAGKGRTCGAVTGGIMALGLYFGRRDPGDAEGARLTRRKSNELIDRFEAECGSSMCAELLSTGNTGIPHTRSSQCAGFVETAARIVGELLLEE